MRGTERARSGFGLGQGLQLLVVLACVAPVGVIGAIVWLKPAPTSSAAVSEGNAPLPPSTQARPQVDFDAIKRIAATPATTTTKPIAFEQQRVDAERLLLKKIARARDARREAGGTIQDLRRAFSVEDLGGGPAMAELGVAAGKRLLVSRPELRVVSPAGAALPTGVDLQSKERDEDVVEGDATLDGKAVRVMRRCVAGELLCLVDIEPRAPAAAGPTTNAELAKLVDAEAAKLASWAPPAPPPATTTTSTTAPPTFAIVAGLIAALVLSQLVGSRLRFIGSRVVEASSRLRAASAGRVTAATTTSLPAEIAGLEVAIDEAAAAMGDRAQRSTMEVDRILRAEKIAEGMQLASTRLDTRIAPEDDAALASVVEAANALIASFESSVVRWKSHADVVAAPPAVSAVEERAQALSPLPSMLVEVAERLLRLARVPGLPPKIVEELNALGKALAERSKSTQTLVDQLLLDAATDRKGDRPTEALAKLRAELAALAPSPSAPVTVHALADLPPEEIAKRLEESA